jgi:hypothetical protein
MIGKTLLSAAAAIALAVPATAAYAQPPEETVANDLISVYLDFENGKSVFINITARDFCDWLPEGPEPPSGPPPVLEPVVTRGVTTGKGAIVTGFEAQDLYIELWDISGITEPIGPCEDIQDQLDAGGKPWATGTADVRFKDNDFFYTETRGNAFGDRTKAMVTDQEGNTYSYRNVFRVNQQCNAPEDGPPACLVDNFQLKML